MHPQDDVSPNWLRRLHGEKPYVVKSRPRKKVDHLKRIIALGKKFPDTGLTPFGEWLKGKLNVSF